MVHKSRRCKRDRSRGCLQDRTCYKPGDFELAAKLAKKALTRKVGVHSDREHIARIESELLEMINNTGIGPGGLGGKTTALAVNIETYATHIAGMPLAVNMCCHVNRHVTRVL